MDTAYTVLEEPEAQAVWERVYKELKFEPSIRKGVQPFLLPAPWVVHDLACYPVDEAKQAFDSAVRQALTASLGDDPWCYALDWHHSYFRYDPRRPIAKHVQWVEDARYTGGGYNAYFPDFYPDGDYYFFVQRDLNWGCLGHPWRRELWLFGAPLIEALSSRLEALGFLVKAHSERDQRKGD